MHARNLHTSNFVVLKHARSLQFIFVVFVILKPVLAKGASCGTLDAGVPAHLRSLLSSHCVLLQPLPRSALPLSRGVAGAHLKLWPHSALPLSRGVAGAHLK